MIIKKKKGFGTITLLGDKRREEEEEKKINKLFRNDDGYQPFRLPIFSPLSFSVWLEWIEEVQNRQ